MIMINVPIHQNPGCEVESVASDDELEEGKDDNDGQTLVDNVRGQVLVDTWEAIVEEVEVNRL